MLAIERLHLLAVARRDDGHGNALLTQLLNQLQRTREKLIFHIVLKIQQFVHDLLAHFIVLKVTQNAVQMKSLDVTGKLGNSGRILFLHRGPEDAVFPLAVEQHAVKVK